MADTLRTELGAWLEGSTPKKSDPKSMRKEWVTDPKRIAGERLRLSVIRTADKRDTHVLTLDVSTSEQRDQALEILGQAADALTKLAEAHTRALKAQAAKPAPKPPTPPKSPPARVANPAPSEAVAANRKIAEQAANGAGAFTAQDWASLIG